MRQQFLRILKGDIEPTQVRKWSQRLLSSLLVGVLAIPLPFIVVKCQDAEWSWAPFLVGYIAFFGFSIIFAGSIVLKTYSRVHTALQRPLTIMVLIIVPILWIAFYELALHRQPVDMMVIFFSVACILALIAATLIKNDNFAKLLTFIIVFFIGFNILQVPFGYQRNRSFLEFYANEKNSIDIIFVGNSHVERAVSEQIVDDVLGVNSHVLIGKGTDMVSAYYFIKQSLDTQNPKLIVVEATPLLIETSFAYKMRGQGVLRGTHYWEALYNRFSVDEYLNVLFPLLYYHSDWGLSDDTFILGTVKDFSYRVYPWLPQKMQKRLSSLAQKYTNIIPLSNYKDKRNYVIEEEDVEYLDKIIRLCQDHNIDLWLFLAPYTVPPEIDVDSIIQARELNYYDFNTNDHFNFSRVHFEDRGHLNNIGTIPSSLQISEIIADSLEIDLNDDMYSRYHSVVVEELAIEVDGEQITYTLNMADSDTSQVEFKWSITTSESVLAKSPFSSQNTISFTMPENGPYTVTFQVRNRNNPEVYVEGTLSERYDLALATDLGLVN